MCCLVILLGICGITPLAPVSTASYQHGMLVFPQICCVMTIQTMLVPQSR